MLARTLGPLLVRDARYYPVITLTGPRQSGKTTLARTTFPDFDYVNLEDTEPRRFARDDPHGFLSRYRPPVIIDEVQRVPDILSAIQVAVDHPDHAGTYVLTGSQNLLLMDRISQTLAGRTGILHLLPLSRAELESQPHAAPGQPGALFSNRATQLDLWSTVRTGFYPRIHDRAIPPEIWLPDYVQTYLARDVRALLNVGDMETFERFLMLAAGRVGQLLNYSSLANDCGVSVDTARRWISVLVTSFVITLLRPYHRNFNKRLVKSPKLYLIDTGLACHLLGIRSERQLATHHLRGALFENYVVAEVVKAYRHHRLQPPLYFWRDRTGHEIDLVIEHDGEPYPVEVKSAETVVSAMTAGLRWWCRHAGIDTDRATLLYAGRDHQRRDGIDVRPWFAI